MATKRANGEGTIRQRTDGRWEGLYTHNGKRKSVYGKTQGEVKQKLNKIIHNIEEGSFIENTNMTFGQWLDTWLETYARPTVRLSTYSSYELNIRGHIKPFLGHIKLKNLRPDMLQLFFNEKQKGGRLDNAKGGLSPKTLKNIYNIIHKALEQAYKNELISKNVSKLIFPPKQNKNEVIVLSVQEQERLQKKCLEHRLGIGIILALYTGLRIGELLGLQWSDINLQNKILHVRRTLNRLTVHDDPNKKTDIIIGEPKTAKGKREIPLQDFLIPLLIKFKKQQQEERLLAGNIYINEDFFICNTCGKHIEPRTYQDLFKKILLEAEITSINFHALRHTFATRALENNFDIKVLADILGHADASTTLNKYAHALPDHKRNSMDKLNVLWG